MKPLYPIITVFSLLMAGVLSSAHSAPIDDRILANERAELQKDHDSMESTDRDMRMEHQKWAKLNGGAADDALMKRDEALLKKHSALIAKHAALIKEHAKLKVDSSGEKSDKRLAEDHVRTIKKERQIMFDHEGLMREHTKMRKERAGT